MNIDVLKNQDESLYTRLQQANHLAVLKNKPSLIKSLLILSRTNLLSDELLDTVVDCHAFSSHVHKALIRLESFLPLNEKLVAGLFLVTTRKHVVAFAELFDYLSRLNALTDTVVDTFCGKRAPWRAVEGFARVEALGMFDNNTEELDDILHYMFDTVSDNCLPVLDAAKELCVLEKMHLNTAANRQMMKDCSVMAGDRLRVLTELSKVKVNISSAIFEDLMKSKTMGQMHEKRDSILEPIELGSEKPSSLAQTLPKNERRAWRTARKSIKKQTETA